MCFPRILRFRHLAVLAQMCFVAMLPAAAADDTTATANLSRMVVVGDSLTAGFQNFSLFHAPNGGQEFGYAALVAKQAGVKLTLPLIRTPGIPPMLTLSGGQIVRAPGMGYRENPLLQPFNLSVPGYLVSDALEHPFPGQPLQNPIDALADVVLGVPNFLVPGCGPIWNGKAFVVKQVQCAVALKPSFVIVSIGSNDALQALTLGLHPTGKDAFATAYHDLMNRLAKTNARIVVANIPDVTTLPFLVPVGVFERNDVCGFTPEGAVPGDFVVPNVVDTAQTTFNLCSTYKVRPQSLVMEAAQAVTEYNDVIAREAAAAGAKLIDFNALFRNIAADITDPNKKGYCAAGKLLTFDVPFGGLFSLDAVHPTDVGYAILANEAISTINKGFDTKIPPVALKDIAKIDPFFPTGARNCN